MDIFTKMKTEHIILKRQLRRIFENKTDPKYVKIPNHSSCAIGRWLYQEGGKHIKALKKDIEELEKKHISFHVLAQEIYDLLSVKNTTHIEKYFSDLEKETEQIINKINKIFHYLEEKKQQG